MRFPALASLAALSLALALPAHAGPVTDAAAALEAAATGGDAAALTAAQDQLQEAAWAAQPLHFRQALPTAAASGGFGVYDPRPDTVYARGEDIFLYAEPQGYGYGDLGDGRFEIGFAVDLRILDTAGGVLVEAPDFMALTHQARGKAREFGATLVVNLTDAPAGDYQLEFTFRDRHSDQRASFTQPVTLK